MSKVRDLCVLLIAAVLSLEIVTKVAIPLVALAISTRDYEQLVVDCEQARAAWRASAQGVTGEKVIDDELRKSIRTQLLSCLHKEVLETKLLSWGVRRPAIRSIELDVISRTPELPYDLERALKG
jgi:hypothetical protein